MGRLPLFRAPHAGPRAGPQLHPHGPPRKRQPAPGARYRAAPFHDRPETLRTRGEGVLRRNPPVLRRRPDHLLLDPLLRDLSEKRVQPRPVHAVDRRLPGLSADKMADMAAYRLALAAGHPGKGRPERFCRKRAGIQEADFIKAYEHRNGFSGYRQRHRRTELCAESGRIRPGHDRHQGRAGRVQHRLCAGRHRLGHVRTRHVRETHPRHDGLRGRHLRPGGRRAGRHARPFGH